VPAGASKEEEERILSRAMNRPVEGPTTYSTGGDVSRFQRSTLPPTREQMMAKQVAMAPRQSVATGAPMAPSGPVVRITRGKTTTAIPVGGN
jgi:pilus assembly protein CpaB